MEGVRLTPQAVIRVKRDGGALPPQAVAEFVRGVVDGSWTRAQAAALLMAIYQRGMGPDETRALLDAMVRSGERLERGAAEAPRVDKHSTGGVGDKVSLVLAPLAAACGLVVPMLSGRGLGHTGGTLDKLEAIPGFTVFLEPERIRRQLDALGCVIAGQTESLAPADRILYALRDETATVESIPLIAASILSKKLAEGLDALLLDVKFGRGAFLARLADAEELARVMVELGHAAGCRTSAWLTRMDAPLGRAVGNAVEVAECVELLMGGGPAQLADLICRQVGGMLHLGGLAPNLESGVERARACLAAGEAMERFRAMVVAQGGDPAFIDDPGRLPQARHVAEVRHAGAAPAWVRDIDARAVAEVVLETGAGRRRAGDTVDHSAGVSALVCVGERVEPGALLARLHHSDKAREPHWLERIRSAITLGPERVDPPPLIVKRIN